MSTRESIWAGEHKGKFHIVTFLFLFLKNILSYRSFPSLLCSPEFDNNAGQIKSQTPNKRWKTCLIESKGLENLISLLSAEYKLS